VSTPFDAPTDLGDLLRSESRPVQPRVGRPLILGIEPGVEERLQQISPDIETSMHRDHVASTEIVERATVLGMHEQRLTGNGAQVRAYRVRIGLGDRGYREHAVGKHRRARERVVDEPDFRVGEDHLHHLMMSARAGPDRAS
jgi:hypothetical protein